MNLLVKVLIVVYVLDTVVCAIVHKASIKCTDIICSTDESAYDTSSQSNTMFLIDTCKTDTYCSNEVVKYIRGGKSKSINGSYQVKSKSLFSRIKLIINRLLGFPLLDTATDSKKKKKKSPILPTKRPHSTPAAAAASNAKSTASVARTDGNGNSRIQKELKSFLASPPDGCSVSVGSNIRVWIVNIVGSDGTIYAGEKYKLKFVFPKDYPSKPPSVYFLKPCPRHQHVYSNGDICLNLLGKDWRPTMTAQLLSISILSMLSSAKEKKLPQDNAMHAEAAPGQQQDNWMYHDDKC